MGFHRIDIGTAQQQLISLVRREHARQQDGGDRREYAQLDLGLAEFGVARPDGQFSGQPEFAAPAPSGALRLASDPPRIPDGVKTEASDKAITSNFVEKHIKVGIEALELVRRHGRSVKHLRFEEGDDLAGEHEADL